MKTFYTIETNDAYNEVVYDEFFKNEENALKRAEELQERSISGENYTVVELEFED